MSTHMPATRPVPRRSSLLSVGLGLALSSAAVARADEAAAPVEALSGDVTNGARLYRLDCAVCHGLTGNGDGTFATSLNPRPARLREGSFLWSHTDEQILEAIAGTNLPDGAPMHGRGLSALDGHDILAWLKQPVMDIGTVYPKAVDYIAHQQTIDRDGLDRAEKIVGRRLTDAEASVMVFVPYMADPDAITHANGHPAKIPEEPGAIYNAKPRRRLGFVTFQTVKLDDGPLDIVLSLSNESRLVDVRTLPSANPKVEHSRERTEKLLHSYVGTGGRVDKKAIEPHEKGVKAPKDVQAAMVLAFERLLEGGAMFQKEERERFALDPDAFNFPAAQDQPENVKFDFKQKKTK